MNLEFNKQTSMEEGYKTTQELRNIQLKIKRVLETIIAVIGLIIVSPIFLIIWILIRVDSPGPALFRQIRNGQYGKEFNVFKFRTMYIDSSIGNLAAPGKGDTRVTRVGTLLRKTSLDEIPQLINVLMGDMSIIGPRAVPKKEIELRLEKLNAEYPDNVALHKEYMEKRELVKPGITGMAQAYGRSSLTTLKATEYDAYYSENYSLMLDIKIFFKTIDTVLFQKGVN